MILNEFFNLPQVFEKDMAEMDKSQTPPGRDGSNDEGGKKEYTAKIITPKKAVKDAEKILNKVLNKKQGVAEGAPIATTPDSIDPGGATDNFKQQLANNTEVAYQKKLASVTEDSPTVHRIGLTVTDPNHPMVSKRGETYQKSVRVTGNDRDAAINAAIAHHRRKGYKVHDHHYMGTVDEKNLTELSLDTLASYKKKAGADASAADKRGDIERGNKRFSGIVKATIKQGEQDAKQHSKPPVRESRLALLKQIVQS